MSAWTLDAFDNPAAREWVAELILTSNSDLLAEAFDTVVATRDAYLEKCDAERGMAALEVLAALLQRPGPTFSEQKQLSQWMVRYRPEADSELLQMGRRTLVRILDDDSELREYWEDTDDFDAWLAEVYELRERLTP